MMREAIEERRGLAHSRKLRLVVMITLVRS